MNDELKSYPANTRVSWKWMGQEIFGLVKSIFFEPVTKEIKGKKIKRNGSPENPAYLVESVAGNLALKLHSELLIPEANTVPRIRPKMFGNK